MKPHERWWQDNIDTRGEEFARWLAESDASSREALYRFVGEAGISDVLECGPGIYIDWVRCFGGRQHIAPANGGLRYRALDVTPKIVAAGRARGIDVIEGSIERIPFPDASVELVYCRAVLEHLPHYRDAMREMLRVSSRFAVAIFWRLDDAAAEDCILFDTVPEARGTYTNIYSRAAVERFVVDDLGVAGFYWIDAGYPLLVYWR